MDRKQFIGYTASAMAGLPISNLETLSRGKDQHQHPFRKDGYKKMVQEAIEYPKLDVNNQIHHLDHHKNVVESTKIQESCKRLGITRAAISNVISNGRRNPETIRKGNNTVLKAQKRYPDLILGQCFVNPGYTEESLAEIDRCVQNGMIMLGELYDDYKISDPVYYPIVEKCIELNIPLLEHGAAPLGNWRKGYPTNNPQTTSTAEDFVKIAHRYPEAMIIHTHIGGGGDWEYAIKVLREAPSVYAGTDGSVYDARMVDMAVNELGADRLLFGTDTSYECGVGKIMFANLTEKEREKIFFDNFNNMLKKAGNNVD